MLILSAFLKSDKAHVPPFMLWAQLYLAHFPSGIGSGRVFLSKDLLYSGNSILYMQSGASMDIK